MSFWSGEKFKEHTNVVEPFSESELDCNSYSLRMGDRFYRTPDAIGQSQTKTILKSGESFVIPPGQFGYLLTRETVAIPPNAMGLISIKTGIKFKGLINVSGFHIDPGYKGKLVFAVYNAGPSPVHLSEGVPTFKLWIADLERRTEILFDAKSQVDISSEIIHGMNKEILSLQSISKELSEIRPLIENLQMIYRGLITALAAALVLGVVAFAWRAGRPDPQLPSHAVEKTLK